MNFISSFLQQNRQRLQLGDYGLTDSHTFLMVTPRFRASSHVVFLILPQGQSQPVLVAKVPRLANGSAAIKREAANLRVVQASRTHGFDSIPRLIAFETYRGYPILVETALVGTLLKPTIIGSDINYYCKLVLDWLIDLQQSTRCCTGTEDSRLMNIVEQPFRYLEACFPLSVEEGRLLEQTWRLVANLRETSLPLVFEHGDLSHPNLFLLSNERLGVVDWELAEPQGVPGYDLFFFLTYAAFALAKANTEKKYLSAFHIAFFEQETWTQPYIKTYAEQLQLPPSVLTPLFALCWLRYLVNLLIRLNTDAGSPKQVNADTAAWLRANRYYALWRHTLTHLHDLDRAFQF